MIDVTQTMACIQCGACVSDCLSMEVDPLFIGPAALAKAYRFVGDPRDAEQFAAPQGPRRGPARHLRLHALLQVHRGLPEGRRADEPDHAPAPHRRLRPRHRRPQQRPPPREGVRHARPATTACCTRPSCCRAPTAATRGSASSRRRPASSSSTRCPSITKAVMRRKVTPDGRAASRTRSRPPTSSRSRRIYDDDRGSRGARRAQPVHLRHRRGQRRAVASASRPPRTPSRRTTPRCSRSHNQGTARDEDHRA